MAQRHEIEAWVNPAAWDDQDQAQRVIDAIEASGSDEESEWVRIAGGDTGDVLAAASRDVDMADLLAEGARDRKAAQERVEDATARLRQLVIDAHTNGMPETQIAKHSFVARDTVRSWVGKGRGLIRATWTGTLTDPETGERAQATITSPVIDATGVEDVDEVARWAVWFATPSWVMEAGESGIDDTTPPASVTVERVTGRAYATAEQLLAAVDNGETWEAEGRDGLEWS